MCVCYGFWLCAANTEEKYRARFGAFSDYLRVSAKGLMNFDLYASFSFGTNLTWQEVPKMFGVSFKIAWMSSEMIQAEFIAEWFWMRKMDMYLLAYIFCFCQAWLAR